MTQKNCRGTVLEMIGRQWTERIVQNYEMETLFWYFNRDCPMGHVCNIIDGADKIYYTGFWQ